MDKELIQEENFNLIEAEQLLLGKAMHSLNAAAEMLYYLTKDDFFLGSHKVIFEAIEKLVQNEKEISSITIIDQLESIKKLNQAGGIETISSISDTYFTDNGIEETIEIIFKKSKARQFDNVLKTITNLRQKSNNLEIVLNKAQTDFLNIDLNYKKSEMQSIGNLSYEVMKEVKLLESNPNELTGVTTGFVQLDKITSGFQNGDLIILAARPSMGKTAFALNLAYNAARQKNNAIAFFSVEMPSKQLTKRIISSMTQINPIKLRTGQSLTTDEWKRLHASNTRLNESKIFIDDTPAITIHQIQSKLRKLKRDEGVNLCIIDYLQLIATPGHELIENRQNEISNISRQLKRIARETGVPIICLSQLSRSVEKREDKRPMMSDLRDSGAIEQDADIVMFLYRDEYYKNKTIENKSSHNLQETELIISKHRNGSIGTIKLMFNLEFGKFLDLV